MNRLATETSPYLLQHAENPVDWYPWGEEAFARARAEDKPIFLSVGYAACHWCHVMEDESFAVPDTAALMNRHFVNVKVDREERPDVDAVYMDAAVAINGSGGWPLSVFLTPDGKPFWAGTYLPPEPRHGLRGFRELLATIATAWSTRRDALEATGVSLAEYLRTSAAHAAPASPIEPRLLDAARELLAAQLDRTWGGFGRAPKFPAPTVVEFLLRDASTHPAAALTLDAMAAGGMYDLVGGGFHRYAVDERWLVPHFEKMLVDNALLATCYLHGWLVLGRLPYRSVVEQTLDYMLRELALEDGGFASSQDADTEGSEGATYTWRRGEGAPDALLEPFEGDRHVLRGTLDEELRLRLLELRSLRASPARDDKAIAAWNGLALAALAEGARHLERPDWLEAAGRLARFVLGPLSRDDGRLYRTWSQGEGRGGGYLDDYASVAHGLLELHAASGELRWLEEAHRLALLAVELFADRDAGGFFQSPVDAERLVARRKLLEDLPAPSGNALLASVLLRLAHVYGDDDLEGQALSALALVAGWFTEAPTAFGYALCTADVVLGPRREVAIVGDLDAPVARAVLARFDPYAVIAVGPSDRVPFLAGKSAVGGRAAVYVCENFACAAPITDASLIEASLGGAAGA